MLITHNSINLERPSIKSRSIVEEEKAKNYLNKHESDVLKRIKHELNLDENENDIKKKKKKRHGINSLSIKKKTKKKQIDNQLNNSIKRKRRRTRQIRMSKHLKEYLIELKQKFSIKDFLKIK